MFYPRISSNPHHSTYLNPFSSSYSMSLPSSHSTPDVVSTAVQTIRTPGRRGKDKRPRKPRKTITQEIVRLVIEQASRDNRPSDKQIAANVGISYGALMTLLKNIHEGKYDFHDEIVYIPEKKGRKRIMTKEMSAMTKDILTSSNTATLNSTKELLATEGINASRTTIWRMVQNENISVQMIAPKPGVVFTMRNVNQRFDFAEEIDEIPNEVLWYIDESGFNLHMCPFKCWSQV